MCSGARCALLVIFDYCFKLTRVRNQRAPSIPPFFSLQGLYNGGSYSRCRWKGQGVRRRLLLALRASDVETRPKLTADELLQYEKQRLHKSPGHAAQISYGTDLASWGLPHWALAWTETRERWPQHILTNTEHWMDSCVTHTDYWLLYPWWKIPTWSSLPLSLMCWMTCRGYHWIWHVNIYSVSARIWMRKIKKR